MTRAERLSQLLEHGRGLASFCRTVRARGDIAVVEEQVDLPRLRATYRRVRDQGLAVARLDELGPTPVDLGRVEALRRRIAFNARSRP